MNDKQFVKIGFNLFCDWHETPPAYRLYVNDELLTERTYIWVKGEQEPCDYWKEREKLCKICRSPAFDGKCRQVKYQEEYLHEVLPLLLPPGVHKIRLESLEKKAKFSMRNLQVKEGPVNIIDSTTFEVLECEQ